MKRQTEKSAVLILGHTGKMGTALMAAFSGGDGVQGRNSRDFDAGDLESVNRIIDEARPRIVINSAAFLGIDPCERDAERALRMNALYPKRLAELSNERDFLLVHFSTDAVFSGEKGGYYVERDAPDPVNSYGRTKQAGDCFVQTLARRYYLVRVPVLFGESHGSPQFVEKMLQRAEEGRPELKVSADIVSSPSYSRDIAAGVKALIEQQRPFGLYHMANEGQASLYDLMKEIVRCLDLDACVSAASHHDFPSIGKKNTRTPLRSEKIQPLRPWTEAVAQYCREIKEPREGLFKKEGRGNER